MNQKIWVLGLSLFAISTSTLPAPATETANSKNSYVTEIGAAKDDDLSETDKPELSAKPGADSIAGHVFKIDLSHKISSLIGSTPIIGASPAAIARVKEYGGSEDSPFHADSVLPNSETSGSTSGVSEFARSVIKQYEKSSFEPKKWDGKFTKEGWNQESPEGWVMRSEDFKAFIKQHGLFGLSRRQIIDFLGQANIDDGKNVIGYNLTTWWCGNAYSGVELYCDKSDQVSKYRYISMLSKEPWITKAPKKILLDPRCSK